MSLPVNFPCYGSRALYNVLGQLCSSYLYQVDTPGDDSYLLFSLTSAEHIGITRFSRAYRVAIAFEQLSLLAGAQRKRDSLRGIRSDNKKIPRIHQNGGHR